MNFVSVKEAVFPFPLVQLRYGLMGVGGFPKLSFSLNQDGMKKQLDTSLMSHTFKRCFVSKGYTYSGQEHRLKYHRRSKDRVEGVLYLYFCEYSFYMLRFI